MTGSLGILALAVTAFVAAHFLLSAPPVRSRVIAMLGEKPFRGVYSLISIALLVWVAMAYNAAPYAELWAPATWLRHLSLSLMPLAFLLVVGGVTTPNPTAVGADPAAVAAGGPAGMLKVTRHPVMWGVGLWGILHLLANGDVASLLLFGGLTVLAIGGAVALEAKKRAAFGPVWEAFAAQTSFVPLVALLQRRTRLPFAEIGWWRLGLAVAVYFAFLFAHPWLFGVDPMAT